MVIHVLIADDHSVVRRGLRMFLEDALEIVVAGEARNGVEAVAQARALRPDVVLMDLLMPEMDGITATAIIRRDLPQTEVIALTSALDDKLVIGMISAGAIGYLLKDTRADALCQAIQAAAAGQVQLASEAKAVLLREAPAPDSPGLITPRERDVLCLLTQGKANKQIALDLGIGETTVRTHISAILAKLGVRSRTQAALYAAQVGMAKLA